MKTQTQDSPTLTAALVYASRGWPVFPVWWPEAGKCACGNPDCPNPAKHPIGKLVPNGHNGATTDPAIIRRWWTASPSANIGIPTGPESDLVVVDIDPRHDGDKSLKKLPGLMPLTTTANTGGGGEHYFFKYPGNGQKIKSRNEMAGFPGIDQKAGGGYIVASPSNHISGGVYSWKIPPSDTYPLAPIPDWLMTLLIKGVEEPRREAEGQAEDKIFDGKRNTHLASLAGSMRRRGMTEEEIEIALQAVNQLRCSPPLSEEEVAKIAESIGRYEPASNSKLGIEVSVANNLLQSPPPFPIDVFPERCHKAILEIQRAHATPVEIPGVALLAEASACIGRTRGIRIKEGWVEHANLWLAIVGKSGLGKSPVVRAIQRPVFSAEKKWYAKYQEDLRVYEQEMENRRGTRGQERLLLPPPPAAPIWRQLIVDDTTTEALTDVLDGNPRGILWNRDELSGLILDLDKYSGKDGGTKSRLMSAYDSGPWKVNRKDKSKKAFIPQATLSIFGTIQPQALPTIFSNLDAATGFLPRFIFINASLKEPPLWTDRTVSGETHEYLASLVEGLLSLNFNDCGGPSIVEVSPQAKAVYQEWYDEQVMEPWVDTSAEVYEAVLAKLRGQCLRLALILHCIEAVTRGSSELKPVSYQTMQNAISLADCFKAHQKRVWRFVVNPDHVSDLTPLQERVARSIVALEAEIHGGMLPTARIAQELNKGFDPKFHIPIESVGKAAGKLGLNHGQLPDKSARTVVITESDLNKIKSIFKITVPIVRSVPNPDGATSCGQNQAVPQPSEVSTGETDGRTDWTVADGSGTGKEPHDIRTSDGSDGCLEPKIFNPSLDWQEVPEGVVIPPGGDGAPEPGSLAGETPGESQDLVQCGWCQHYVSSPIKPGEKGSCRLYPRSWNSQLFLSPDELHSCPSFDAMESIKILVDWDQTIAQMVGQAMKLGNHQDFKEVEI